MTYRPHYPKTDANHSIVTKVIDGLGGSIHGKPLYALDTSKLGGESLDWIVWVGPVAVVLEVKRPGERERLTSGERLFISNCPGPVHVVETEDEVVSVLSLYAQNVIFEVI